MSFSAISVSLVQRRQYNITKPYKETEKLNTTTTTTIHPFNGLFSGKNRVSRYQKGQTILDFNEAHEKYTQIK